jgi:voltage-gated potassium channel Kch
MSNLKSFHRLFFQALAKIQDIFFVLLGWLVVDAAAIAYFEQIPFAEALYFSFVTGLTIGYGDISPVTPVGRVVAVLTGFIGILMTGLIAAIAVYALRETMKHPTDGQ